MKDFIKFIKYSRDLMNSILSREKGSASLHLTFVLGNESCDLDSVMSALAFAYLNFSNSSLPSQNQKTSLPISNYYIPLLNVSRQDFASRFDSQYLLKKWGVFPEELIYFEELLSYQKITVSQTQKVDGAHTPASLLYQNEWNNEKVSQNLDSQYLLKKWGVFPEELIYFEELLSYQKITVSQTQKVDGAHTPASLLYQNEWNNEKVSQNLDVLDQKKYFSNQKLMDPAQNFDIFLVDHNILALSQNSLKSYIREIIDHHEDKVDSWLEPGQQVRKSIRLAGSCCVLVAERILKEAREILDEELVFGLYLTIIVDSYNFDTKFKNIRWVEKDWEVFLELKEILDKKCTCIFYLSA